MAMFIPMILYLSFFGALVLVGLTVYRRWRLWRVIDWLLSDGARLSSNTILAAMLGRKCDTPSVPFDSSDFGSCYRLLEIFPEWRPRLAEVAARYPRWAPLVERWDDLSDLYRKSRTDPASKHKLFTMLHHLNDVRVQR